MAQRVTGMRSAWVDGYRLRMEFDRELNYW